MPKARLSVLLLIILCLGGCASVTTGNGSPTMQASFMLQDCEGPNGGGAYSEELGTNTIAIYLDDWKNYEILPGVFSWSGAFPTNTWSWGHVIVRLGILHRLAWTPTACVPSWISTAELDGEFKTGYGKFVQEAVSQLKLKDIKVDAYLVELESNFAGHEISGHEDITNQWIIDWIKWEAALIRGLDPAAKIIVPLTPTEFRSKETLDNTGDKGKIPIKDFVSRMIASEVSFEAFGFNINDCVYDDLADLASIEAVVADWSGIDKEIFVWGLGFPADNSAGLAFNYPRAGGYSEEWQSAMFSGALKLFLDNPKFIGLCVDLYDFYDPAWGDTLHCGLVSGEYSSPEKVARPAFDAFKDYWQAHYR